MKKLILTLSITVISYCSYSQNSDPWPTTGNVGIGTSTPLTGGTNANWLTLNGISTYGGGIISSVGGVPKGYSYYDSSTNSMALQGASGIDVTLQPGNSTTLIAKAGGNVGIGTTTPLENLSVIAPNNTTNQIGFGVSGEQKSALYHTNSDGLLIYSSIITNANHPFHFLTGGVTADERLTILGNGNVGIGTRSPSAPLDVASSANYSWASQITNNGTTNAHGLYVNIGPNSTGVPFLVGNNGMLQVSNNGNVLIGKTSQTNTGYKLDINGKARANEIVVNSDGADFVFEPEYNLPKLSEVKIYIDQHHHLPQIPSAAEMQKNGMNVGELNTKLLQKVEELTLYLIKQNEQIAEQKSINKSLQTQINRLAKRR